MISPRNWHQEDQVEAGGHLAKGLCQEWQWREACGEQLVQGRDSDAGECVSKKKVLYWEDGRSFP